MGAPIVHALRGEGKVHCQKYCPRGSLLGKFLDKVSMKNNHPKFMTTKQFKNALLILMLTVFSLSMAHTGGDFTKIAFAMFRFMTMSLIIGILMGIFYKPRTWCIVCPMGHATGLIKSNMDHRLEKNNAAQPVQITVPKRAA